MDSTNNLQRIPSDGDFFISATAPFAHREVTLPSYPSPPPHPQERLTQMNLMTQCVRDEHQRRLSTPHDDGTVVTRSSSSLPASPSLSKKGANTVHHAFLPPESAAQRMSFVTDLTARMQEHVQQQRGRCSPSTRAIVDALTLVAGKRVVAGGSAAASRCCSSSPGFPSSHEESDRRPPRNTRRLSSGTYSHAAQTASR